MSMTNISVIGLGFVGLPLLISISKKKKLFNNIIGIEANNSKGRKRVAEINNIKKKSLFTDNKLNKILINNLNYLTISNNFKIASNSDFIFFCLPLNIDKNLNTNFKNYYDLIKKYYIISKKNSIFILNSTINPGFTSKILNMLKKEKIFRKDIFFVYYPERVTPGINYYKSIVYSHKVFSSNSNKFVSRKIKKLFSQIFDTKNFKLTEFNKYEEAECVKVLENSYRASNIALIEEWGVFAEEFRIDLFSILNAIKFRSTHSNIMRPGLGVGGYCLTKDPYFIKLSSKEFLKNKVKFPFINLTMDINSKMHLRTINKIKKIISSKKRIKKILILGLSYAENVDDLRNSKSLDIVDKIKKIKSSIEIYDPVVKTTNYHGIKIIKKIKDFNMYDLLILNVKHSKFEKVNFKKIKSNMTIVDTNNVLSVKNIDILSKKGIDLNVVGRGDL